MKDDNRLAEKVKEQMENFSLKLSVGLSKPKRHFLSQMIYGIQSSRDIKLSNISRSLGEEIKLIKTENRLSRNLKIEDISQIINQRLVEAGRRRVHEETVLSLDLTDIHKPYAKKMDFLAQVFNGSAREPRPGYWICEVIGAEPSGDATLPLYSELYSQKADEFESENAQIIKALDTVTEKVGNRGIWTIDRGGDRDILYRHLLGKSLHFVIRLKGNRHLLLDDEVAQEASLLANSLRCGQRYQVKVNKEGCEQELEIRLGEIGVRLPRAKEKPLKMVVVKGFGEKPMMLLTNVSKTPKEILEIYLTRWKCEESFRFIKQQYHLEDIRVRSYSSLRNLVALVQAVFYFVSIYLGKRLRLNILLKKILEKAQRFFQIPVFRQYATADGIARILYGSKWGLRHRKIPPENAEKQISFSFLIEEL